MVLWQDRNDSYDRFPIDVMRPFTVLIGLPHSRVFDPIIRAINEQAKLRQWKLVVARTDSILSLEQICDPVVLEDVRAVIVHAGIYHRWPREVFTNRTTITIADATPPPDIASVGFDEQAIGKMAADYLLQFNCEGYACFSLIAETNALLDIQQFEFAERRTAGFLQHLEAVGAVVHPGGTHFSLGLTGTNHLDTVSIGRWLAKAPRPLGVFVACDSWAATLQLAAEYAGWKIPDDMRMIGVGNEELVCETAPERLSSIALPWRQIGLETVSLIERQASPVGHELSSRIHHIALPPIEVIERNSTALSCPTDPLVGMAVRFIEQNLHRPLSVGNILRHVPAYRRELERGFRLHLKRSIGDVIRHFRFERAKHLLRTTDMPIETIARSCGLSSPSKLANLFAKHYNMSPSAYRRISHQGH